MSSLERALAGKRFLIGIGAMKAGTTWLGNYLAEHEDVCLSPLKEVHYFDAKHRADLCGNYDQQALYRLREIVNEKIRTGREAFRLSQAGALVRRLQMIDDETAYLRHFADVYRGEKLLCELTPSYSLLDASGFSAIKAMLPGAVFLLVMRNPVERYWSHLRFNAQLRPRLKPMRDAARLVRKPEYWERGDYGRTLRELSSAVGDKDILTLFYEDLFHPSAETGLAQIRRLEAFSGIGPGRPQLGEIVNPSRGLKMSDRLRGELVRAFEPVYRWAIERFGAKIPPSWLADIDGCLD